MDDQEKGTASRREPYNMEREYDRDVDPVVDDLVEACRKHDLPMIAVVCYRNVPGTSSVVKCVHIGDRMWPTTMVSIASLMLGRYKEAARMMELSVIERADDIGDYYRKAVIVRKVAGLFNTLVKVGVVAQLIHATIYKTGFTLPLGFSITVLTLYAITRILLDVIRNRFARINPELFTDA